MEYRPIEVKIIRAHNLKDVNVFSTMDVYVICSVSGDPRSTQKTPIDKSGGTNPKWNYRMKFAFDEPAARLNRLGLVFQIISDRTLGDKEAGRVYVPLKELFDSVELTGKEGNSGDISIEEKWVTYQVQTTTGKFKGHLEFSYKFGEKFNHTVDRRFDEPVLGYSPGAGLSQTGPGPHLVKNGPGSMHKAGPGSNPIQPRYEPGYPSQGPPGKAASNRFGYPSQGQGPSGYGYSGQGQGPKAKEGSEIGMGTAAVGVGAGLMGGLLVGEMINNDVSGIAACDGMMDGGGGGGMFDF